MKINQKYYDVITTEPFDVHTTELGKVEMHSLNDYPTLHTQNTSQGRFAVWFNKGGDDYKLLVDNNYYETLKPLYTKEINQIWLEFYNFITKERKKALLMILLPVAILLLLFVVLISYVIEMDADARLYVTIGIFILFFVANKIINSKINKMVERTRNDSIDKIKDELGESTFNNLLDAQEEFVKAYYKEKYVEQYGEEGYEDNTQDDNQLPESSETDSNEE